MKVLSVIWLICLTRGLQCANILSIFCNPVKSHSIMGVRLARGLIQKGHHVTLISPYDMGTMENFTNIQLKGLLKAIESSLDYHKGPSNNLGMLEKILISIELRNKLNEAFWKDPEIQKILRDKPKYDVVISSLVFSDGILAIPYQLGVPSIGFTAVGSNSLINKFTANPNMAYVSSIIFEYSGNTFLERLKVVAGNVFISLIYNVLFDPIDKAFLDEQIPNAPSFEDLRKNTSLVLLNSHASIEPPRPYQPNMIQIGGFHLQNINELPEDIKTYLDDCKHGVILFSLGSIFSLSGIDEEKREAILKVLGEMDPVKVLLKTDIELKNLSKNIMIKEWLPQADILGHPNIKLFISHGGLGGNTESVYHGVPILGLPFTEEQRMNLNEAERAGYAEFIDISELTEDLFRKKLIMVLNNPKYALNAKKRSALIKEQPVKPMDKAAYWIEHIINYGGGSHLRSDGMDLTWYQLYMVDIYVFCTVILGLILFTTYHVTKLSVRIVKQIFCKINMKVKSS